MSFKRLVVPILVLVIFAGGAFAAYQVADLGQKSAARDDGTTAGNETLVQQVGVWQLVGNATNEFTAGFNDSVTVYNSTGVELERGTDYQWNSTDGTIKFEDTDSTTDSATANVTYTYFTNTGEVQQLAGPLGVITEAVGRLGFLAAGLALVVFLIALGALVAKFVMSSGPKSNR